MIDRSIVAEWRVVDRDQYVLHQPSCPDGEGMRDEGYPGGTHAAHLARNKGSGTRDIDVRLGVRAEEMRGEGRSREFGEVVKHTAILISLCSLQKYNFFSP